MLEGGAYALRNIAITYDTAEKALAGGKLRDLVKPTENRGASFTLAGASASGDAGSAYAGVMESASAVAGEVYAKADSSTYPADGPEQIQIMPPEKSAQRKGGETWQNFR